MIEALTDELEAAVRELMAEVDERGGAVEAITSGFVQREIHKSALAWQREVESGERAVVGVNSYQEEEEPPSISRPDPAQREQVLSDLAAVRAERDSAAVEGALAAVESAARGAENIMPALIQAVGCYATLGEISGVLQGVFGEHRAVESI
jgi:methylmalonyl-CoA mutase N-terminal domain/subunit